MAGNSNLHKAKDTKNDEFYTQIADIEREILKIPKNILKENNNGQFTNR